MTPGDGHSTPVSGEEAVYAKQTHVNTVNMKIGEGGDTAATSTATTAIVIPASTVTTNTRA